MADNSKYEGKTAAELIAMLQAQESFQGKQADEIGRLRGAVQQLDATVKATQRKAGDDGTTPKDQYRKIDAKLAERAILDPVEGLSQIKRDTVEEATTEAERRVTARLEQKAEMDRQIEAYMKANPVLQKWSDVFSVAGAQIFNRNPNVPLGEILEGAKAATLEWLKNKGIKAEDEQAALDRKRAGITTGGGSGDRDTEGLRGAQRDEEGRQRVSTGDAERDNIMNAINDIKGWKEKRALPPRSR